MKPGPDGFPKPNSIMVEICPKPIFVFYNVSHIFSSIRRNRGSTDCDMQCDPKSGLDRKVFAWIDL